jgi:hypothetical protein
MGFDNDAIHANIKDSIQGADLILKITEPLLQAQKD